MTKQELRILYKEKRKELNAREVAIKTDLILINFQKIDLPFLSVAHTYVASQKLGEVETFHLIEFLKFKNPGIKILVPKVDLASGKMEHFHFQEDTEMIENFYGIAEPSTGIKISPEEIDLVLVPLLAFDKTGYRVGYGKGYYDKFLEECREDVIKIGLSFFEPEEQIDDRNQFDIRLSYCVTPEDVYLFKPRSKFIS